MERFTRKLMFALGIGVLPAVGGCDLAGQIIDTLGFVGQIVAVWLD